VIHLNSIVSAIGTSRERTIVRCANGKTHAGEAAILTVPLPLLQQIALPPTVREKAAAAAADIGFGNVIKLLLRFKTRWWTSGKGSDLSDLLFLLSEETIPVWWTQHPTEHPVLTGWVAGPKTEGMAHLDESDLIETGLASLADIFGLSPSGIWSQRGRSIGQEILSHVEPIPTPRSKRVRRSQRSHARAVRFSFQAKRSTAGETWARSRRR
jgi:monoamine oxidase